MTQLTLGQFRVGVSFNPSNNAEVDIIKAIAANLIDAINALPSQDSEQARLKALAMTEIESAAMWAVKAATKQPMPEHLKQAHPMDARTTAPSAPADPFDVACRDAAIAVMDSADPKKWGKSPESWQILDMLGLIGKKGFSGIQISDVYATLDRMAKGGAA